MRNGHSERNRRLRAQRLARVRARRKAGVMVVPVEVDARILEYLIGARVLPIEASEDRARIGGAINRVLRSLTSGRVG
jgi:hypothetical protein